MKDALLYIIAVITLLYINFYNRRLVKKKGGIKGYDRSQAFAIDVFAGRNYRTLWNETLITKDGYKFGVEGETMSSTLGKNEIDNTLTNEPQLDMPKWFYGTNLSKILDKLFYEDKHCINTINLEVGEWEHPLNNKPLKNETA